jgi:predicted transcriptional regulator of viral defense system
LLISAHFSISKTLFAPVNHCINWKEINSIYGYPLKVKAALNKGEIYKVDRGFYSDKPLVRPFVLIAAKYPYAIITMDTVFFIYGLTDVIPDKTFLATMRNATRITDNNVTQVFLSARIFEHGKTKMEYDRVTITIYDRERMLVEALRNSKVMPFDYYKEIIAGYRKTSENLDYRKVEDYISLFKRSEHLFNAFRREVL